MANDFVTDSTVATVDEKPKPKRRRPWMPPPSIRRVNAYIGEAHYARLLEFAERHGIGVSEALRRCIDLVDEAENFRNDLESRLARLETRIGGPPQPPESNAAL